MQQISAAEPLLAPLAPASTASATEGKIKLSLLSTAAKKAPIHSHGTPYFGKSKQDIFRMIHKIEFITRKSTKNLHFEEQEVP